MADTHPTRAASQLWSRHPVCGAGIVILIPHKREMRLSIMSGRTLRGKSWKSCLNWLVFLGSLEQSLRAKFNLMLLTVVFGPGQQDQDRKEKRRERCVINSPQQHSAPSVPQRLPDPTQRGTGRHSCRWLWLVF